MFRRPHCCIFIVGTLLLLAAVGLIMHSQFAGSHAHAYRMLRVAEAVDRVQNDCDGCHDPFAAVSPLTDLALVRHSPLDPVDFAPASAEMVAAALLQESVDARLVDLGLRIQALPAVELPHQDDVVDAYLETVSTTRTIAAARSLSAAHQMTADALWRIDGIDALLRDLENAASPVKWTAPSGSLFQPHAVTATVSSASPVTVCVRPGAAVSTPAWDGWTVTDTAQLALPQEIVYATHRRGPPSAGLSMDSVGSGRLLSRDMQSPFLFGGRERVPVV
jgi:hypothetical protein